MSDLSNEQPLLKQPWAAREQSSTAKKFYSYSDDAGFELHKSAEDAIASSEVALQQYREAAQSDGEWPTETDSVQWGEVRQIAVATSREEDVGIDYVLQNTARAAPKAPQEK